jgi:hypothetical protein
MPTIKQLHEQNVLENSPIDLHLIHKFDRVTKSWKFNGYRCVLCGSSFKHVDTIVKHKSICRELKRENKRSYGADEPELVITTDRKIWQPLTVNTT